MDRDILLERLLDNLELYFDCKSDLNRKSRGSYDFGKSIEEIHSEYWQEYEMLDNLRLLVRATLDEYVMGACSKLHHVPVLESDEELHFGNESGDDDFPLG